MSSKIIIQDRVIELCILFLLTLTGCKYDPHCKTDWPTVYLSDFDKSRVPYSGNDTIVFVSNNGDTAICVGNGKASKIQKDNVYMNPDCGKHDEFHEYIEYDFLSNDTILFPSFQIYIYANPENVFVTYVKVHIQTEDLQKGTGLLQDVHYYTYKVMVNGVEHKVAKLSSFKGGGIIYYNHHSGIFTYINSTTTWNVINIK